MKERRNEIKFTGILPPDLSELLAIESKVDLETGRGYLIIKGLVKFEIMRHKFNRDASIFNPEVELPNISEDYIYRDIVKKGDKFGFDDVEWVVAKQSKVWNKNNWYYQLEAISKESSSEFTDR